MTSQNSIGNVLLVDDDQTTNHVNKRLLLRSGFAQNVEVAKNGQEAIDYLNRTTSSGAGSGTDLLLLDLKMEGMDGFSFLEAYSQLPEEKKAKILVALTSSASFYDLTRLQQFPDVSEHIYKPLTDGHLKNLKERFLSL